MSIQVAIMAYGVFMQTVAVGILVLQSVIGAKTLEQARRNNREQI